MGEYLSFVTLDTWTLIFTWVNLFILFMLVKKFFFKPISNMLEERKNEIESDYTKAREAQAAAEELKDKYEGAMKNAKDEADRIVTDAAQNASLRGDAIVKEAQEKAEGMIQRAQKSIEASRNSAFAELKDEVSSMAVDIAKKIIEKDIDEKEHEDLINRALEGLGGVDE